MLTFDRRTIDASGAFLIGELEKLDQTVNLPLQEVTWQRDIDLRDER
jgi:small nuclear ribonucleoprotein (snRNP)-like protein